MNTSIKNSPKHSIDTTSTTSWKEMTSKGDNPDSRNLERLGSLDKTQPIVVLNFFKFRDIAVYPDNYSKRKISGRMAYSKYSRVPQKFFPIYGMEIMVGGNFISSIVGDDSDWDSYAFVKYPSFEILEMMTTSKIYQDVLIHREAALEKTDVFISSPFKE